MSNNKGHINTPSIKHDHQACITTALTTAEKRCRKQGVRLTATRHRVLELVWESHRPVGAYTLLEQISREGWSAAPPTIYRALDFLLEHGLIHRIASLNAYVGCNHLEGRHAARFFICEHCGDAAELGSSTIDNAIAVDADTIGFQVTGGTVEISGICSQCSPQE